MACDQSIRFCRELARLARKMLQGSLKASIGSEVAWRGRRQAEWQAHLLGRV